MFERLDTLLEVVEKTGEKVIFADLKCEKQYVIMPLPDYLSSLEKKEAVLERKRQKADILTESRDLDTINRDIALWKNEQESEREGIITSILEDTLHSEVDDTYYFEPLDE